MNYLTDYIANKAYNYFFEGFDFPDFSSKVTKAFYAIAVITVIALVILDKIGYIFALVLALYAIKRVIDNYQKSIYDKARAKAEQESLEKIAKISEQFNATIEKLNEDGKLMKENVAELCGITPQIHLSVEEYTAMTQNLKASQIEGRKETEALAIRLENAQKEIERFAALAEQSKINFECVQAANAVQAEQLKLMQDQVASFDRIVEQQTCNVLSLHNVVDTFGTQTDLFSAKMQEQKSTVKELSAVVDTLKITLEEMQIQDSIIKVKVAAQDYSDAVTRFVEAKNDLFDIEKSIAASVDNLQRLPEAISLLNTDVSQSIKDTPDYQK